MIRNPIPWPDGARCAACLSFDMDADSLIHIAHPKDAHRRVAALSMLKYGPEIGIPRIVDTYARLDVRQTFFIPGWCIEQYPRAIETILRGGHEIAHHGYLHEHPGELSDEAEAYCLERGMEVIRAATGQPPRGWRAPLYNFSHRSADLLIERGFTYDASLMGDDQPYLLDNGKGRLVELPSHWGMDDWPQFVQSSDLDYMMPIRAPREGWQIFAQEFEAALEFGGLWIPVLHPFATGRLARWRTVEQYLLDIRERSDVWFAPLEEIAAHVNRVVREGAWQPRIDRVPYYRSTVAPAAVRAGSFFNESRTHHKSNGANDEIS